MVSCCCCKDDPNAENKKLKDELCNGPVKSRGCTDIFCIPIFAFAQVVFFIVTIAGVADGEPSKLYKPRDFQGAYCGVAENWNNGPNTENMPMQSYTMNVTSTVDTMMKQLVCSSIVSEALTEGAYPLLTTQAKRDEYLCECCLSPCSKCTGSLEVGGDLTSASGLKSTITARMTELTNPSAAADLFSPSGANGDMFSATDFWNEATKYFNSVCLPDCSTNYKSTLSRNYTYSPAPDDGLYPFWVLLNTSANTPTDIKNTIRSVFTFQAYDQSICPYSDPAYCVPFPGMEFGEVVGGSGYCTFQMAAEVAGAVGDAAAGALSSLGSTAFASAVTDSFGSLIGDMEETIPAFIVVSILSFIVGIVFLVLLRFFIGICVWIAVACTVFFFLLGGALLYVLSQQCAGADLLSTGTEAAVAVAVAGTTAASTAISGDEAVSEDMTGDGADYRGIQRYTKSGKPCVNWNTQTRMPGYTPTDYPDANLVNNYCRNPYNATDSYKGDTIWCVTSDTMVVWEECYPIGVILPECEDGYAIDDETHRDVILYCSYIVWGLGGLWVLVILCLVNRIRLAIALNKVAAQFLSNNPHTVLIPVVQAIVGIIWVLIWCLSATFLLSQVPADYTPTTAYATYAEAYGTTDTPGACNDKWPQGQVWKDTSCEVEGDVTKCYKCYPPRYIFDVRFAISFFVFLWNNAFNVALGQILIAMAVSTWFFTAKEKKGKVKVVWESVKTICRYHIGSVAFGSFIIAVVQFIRYVMKYLEKQASAQKNRVMVYVLKLLQCCMWCFEKCLKFLNKNAYIQIALNGTNFCKSAYKAFFLIARNLLRFGTVAMLSGMVHTIGFICIIAGTVVIGYFIVGAMHEEVNPLVPCLMYFGVSYVIAKLYMNVFGLAVDTSLQCFLACEEMDGCGDFVPSTLRNFVKKKIEGKGEADSD